MKYCKVCGIEITAKDRKVFCSTQCYNYAKHHPGRFKKLFEDKQEEPVRSVPGMKNADVCKGCKYLLRESGILKGTCNYMEITGHSRIVVERANGGVKADSCCCYEAGNRAKKRKGAY